MKWIQKNQRLLAVFLAFNLIISLAIYMETSFPAATKGAATETSMSTPTDISGGTAADAGQPAPQNTGSISGFLWNDGDGSLPTDWNGTYDTGESPLAGYTVCLYISDGTTAPANSAAPIAQTQTGQDGTYIFKGLAPGNYAVGVGEDTVDGRGYLLPAAVTSESKFAADESANPPMAFSDVIAIGDGTAAENINAGMRLPRANSGSISGFLWVDGNGTLPTDWNGLYDSGEEPLLGYTVTLYAADDKTAPVAQIPTDENGAYKFEGLAPGSYVVGLTSDTVNNIEYLLPMSVTAESKFTVDWNTDPLTAFSDVIEIGAGAAVENINAGMCLPMGFAPSSAGTVYGPYTVTNVVSNTADTTISTSGGVYEVTGNSANAIIVNNATCVIVLNNANRTAAWTRLQINGTANVTIYLADGSTNSFITAGNYGTSPENAAGISVAPGATLTITGPGSLTAVGRANGAGIGASTTTGGALTAGGTINIDDGRIAVQGGAGRAGIDGGSVNVTGGAVIATTDTILTNGLLNANPALGSGLSVKGYVWLSSDSQTGTYTPASAQALSNGGASVYVAADNGAWRWYEVQVTLSDDTVITSVPYQIPYYPELMNGSFENTPVTSNMQLPQATTANLYWKTTASDGLIEVANIAGMSSYSSYLVGKPLPDGGKQFGELNATQVGTLYQDVLVVPGENLSWSLDHAGRNGTDVMHVVIMPTAQVPAGLTSAQATAITQSADGSTQVTSISDTNTAWNSGNSGQPYTGGYHVPDGVYAVRFFFVSYSTVGGATVGNLLDGVKFGVSLNYSVEYYLDGMRQAINESGAGLLGDTISARNTSQFSGCTLAQSTLSSDANPAGAVLGGTSFTLSDQNSVLKLYYVSNSTTNSDKNAYINNDWTAAQNGEAGSPVPVKPGDQITYTVSVDNTSGQSQLVSGGVYDVLFVIDWSGSMFHGYMVGTTSGVTAKDYAQSVSSYISQYVLQNYPGSRVAVLGMNSVTNNTNNLANDNIAFDSPFVDTMAKYNSQISPLFSTLDLYTEDDNAQFMRAGADKMKGLSTTVGSSSFAKSLKPRDQLDAGRIPVIIQISDFQISEAVDTTNNVNNSGISYWSNAMRTSAGNFAGAFPANGTSPGCVLLTVRLDTILTMNGIGTTTKYYFASSTYDNYMKNNVAPGGRAAQGWNFLDVTYGTTPPTFQANFQAMFDKSVPKPVYSDPAGDVVTDKIPAGLTVDEASITNGGVYDKSTGTITWNLTGLSSNVTLLYNTTVSAAGEFDNTADITSGDGTAHQTNTTYHLAAVGVSTTTLTISKTVDGMFADLTKQFTFTLTFIGADGNPLAGPFAYTGDPAAGPPDGTLDLTDGAGKIALGHGQSITLQDVPTDCSVQITETPDGNYDTTFTDSENAVTPDPASPNDTGLFPMTANPRTIAFTNTRVVPPPTGISPGGSGAVPLLPALALLALAVFIGKKTLLRKKG